MIDKICSCPREYRNNQVVIAYLDALCPVHSQQEFDVRRKIASMCDVSSRLILAIDELPKESSAETCQALLKDIALKLRSAVLAAT